MNQATLPSKRFAVPLVPGKRIAVDKCLRIILTLVMRAVFVKNIYHNRGASSQRTALPSAPPTLATWAVAGQAAERPEKLLACTGSASAAE